jgi:hypothetical protein
MKKLSMLLALAVVLAGNAFATDNTAQTGVGVGIVLPSGDTNPCPGSDLLCNHDGSFENGVAWIYGGIVPPYYGAFAEGYNGAGTVCGIQLELTQTGGFTGQSMDCYVWDSDGTNPNNVLSVTTGVVPSAPGLWPNITAHDIDSNDAVVTGDFFVGYWANWPGLPGGWYCAIDQDGFGGLPRTNFAPGIGYPTGWGDPSMVGTWAPVQAMGICAYLSTEPIPVTETTWGAIKALY